MAEIPNNSSDRQPSLNNRITRIDEVLIDTTDLVLAHNEVLKKTKW
jgi:hypothetical protein